LLSVKSILTTMHLGVVLDGQLYMTAHIAPVRRLSCH